MTSLEGEDAAGGLAVGLHAALKRGRGLWFGWNGRIGEDEGEAPRIREGDGYRLATLGLSEAEHAGYYAGFANRALWPVLHGRVDLMRFGPEDLMQYLAVNDRFARQLLPLLANGEVVWVHDYHFIALGEGLRRRGVRLPIGFFLHVPFPSADMVAALPCHRELMQTLAAYDLVGFQTEASVQNFKDYVVRHLHGKLIGDDVRLAGRSFRVGCFPIGIDVDRFAGLAKSEQVQRLIGELAPRFPLTAGIAGVDRLDYTKGLPLRLRAFERFLAEAPQWHGRATLIQVAAPSREVVPEYAQLRDELEALSGRINARHGRIEWVPLRYINRSLSQWQLAALYRLSRVGLVTPLADGMNMVAKEYVAAQDPADPGVLVLSRFAGAAAQLTSALIVNPHDVEAVAAAIREALDMPLEERRSRWAAAMAELQEHDVHAWRERFLRALERRAAEKVVRLSLGSQPVPAIAGPAAAERPLAPDRLPAQPCEDRRAAISAEAGGSTPMNLFTIETERPGSYADRMVWRVAADTLADALSLMPEEYRVTAAEVCVGACAGPPRVLERRAPFEPAGGTGTPASHELN